MMKTIPSDARLAIEKSLEAQEFRGPNAATAHLRTKRAELQRRSASGQGKVNEPSESKEVGGDADYE